MQAKKAMNRLNKESSPYLLQHKNNPVDWHAWGTEALQLAETANKPILLSIGYSACHWCHVMAHESFEDDETAEIMNSLFINIKLDREERPDLDKIYQSAHQLLTQRGGGWPLTIFLTPKDKLPFFAGTYFPKKPKNGMPSFTEVLNHLSQHYEKHQANLKQQGKDLLHALKNMQPQTSDRDIKLNDSPLAAIRAQLAENFDKDWGGFGNEPKFPHPSNLERLLRHWRKSANQSEPDIEALFMTALSISRMQNGGLFDQVGGGFYRYSVDQQWQIPHFEKMLYDNGPLLALTAQLWQASGDDSFRRVASATAEWAIREMQSPEGGFYAALDADSDGQEGLFYLWSPKQLKKLLNSEEYLAIEHLYGLREASNFEGRWHLTNRLSLDDLMERSGYTKSKLQALLDSAQQKMLHARSNRISPNCDTKILVAWNGLMIRGLAIASGALLEPELADNAARAVDFIRSNMKKDHQLFACYADGKARFTAYLDDYAFLLDSVIELLQQRWDSEHLLFAIWLADEILDKFEDKDNGGFFFTSKDHEELLYRPKSFSDDSMSSGNAIAALSLNRMGNLLGDSRYIDAAENTFIAGWETMLEFPHGHAALITALDEYLSGTEIIIVRGEGDEPSEWCSTIRQLFSPERLSFAIPSNDEVLPEALALKKSLGTTTGYVCSNNICGEPLITLTDLVSSITNN
jgi:uncharacterized protein